MELDFTNNMDGSFDSYEEVYQDLLKLTFKMLSIKKNYIVEVNLVDNKEIHEINKAYRNVDRPTDVISFAFLDNLKENDMIKGKRVPVPLGEIIISVDKATEQAKEYGHSLNREMSFLFVHGLLHLLGYDHTLGEKEEKEMFDLQDKILDKAKEKNMLTKEELIQKALEARELSYSPYSHFKVGAAIMTKDGEVFLGSNIENASYPLCMCAERNAIYNAYMHGKTKKDFVMFALTGDTKGPISPCGACRQVISELYPSDKPIYMTNLKGDIKEVFVADLLPFAFDDSDL